MPCYEPPGLCYTCGTAPCSCLKVEQVLLEVLNERTAMLCKLCTVIENYNKDLYTVLISPEIIEWHEQHKEFDKKRKS